MIWYLLTSIVSPCPAAFKSTALGVSSGSADEIEKMLPWSAQKHKLTGILESPVSRFLVFKSKGCQMVPTVWSKGHLFHFFFQRASCCFMLSHHAVPTPTISTPNERVSKVLRVWSLRIQLSGICRCFYQKALPAKPALRKGFSWHKAQWHPTSRLAWIGLQTY